jgi:hypothetical protein
MVGCRASKLSRTKRLLVECKTKVIPWGSGTTGHRAKFYAGANLNEEQTIRFLQAAYGFGIVPAYAFEVACEEPKRREAWLVDADLVMQRLALYGAISLGELRDHGIVLPAEMQEGPTGRKERLYVVQHSDLSQVCANFMYRFTGSMSGVRAWVTRCADKGVAGAENLAHVLREVNVWE